MERKQSPTHLSYQAICSLSKSLLAKFVFLVTQNLPRFQLPFFYTNNIPFSSFSSFFQSPSIRLYKVTFQLVFKRDGSHIFLLGNQHLKSNQTLRAGHIWSGYDRTGRRHINSWTRDEGQRALLPADGVCLLDDKLLLNVSVWIVDVIVMLVDRRLGETGKEGDTNDEETNVTRAELTWSDTVVSDLVEETTVGLDIVTSAAVRVVLRNEEADDVVRLPAVGIVLSLTL